MLNIKLTNEIFNSKSIYNMDPIMNFKKNSHFLSNDRLNIRNYCATKQVVPH